MELNSLNCFTYQQLADFATARMQGKDRSAFQQHLLDCELCGLAVKGFEIIPFTMDEMKHIEKRMEQKINKLGPISHRIQYGCLAGIMVLLIFTFYNFVESFSKKPSISIKKLTTVTIAPVDTKKEGIGPKVTAPKKNRKNTIRPVEIKQERKELYELVTVQPIKTFVNEVPKRSSDSSLSPVYMADAVYIYNLKVAGYFDLYFKVSGKKTVDFTNHIPSFKENRTAENGFDNDIVTTTTLESILKKGLFYFSKENYSNSITEFNKLLEHTPDDINALFYTAMAYSKSAHYERAIKNFDKVLNHSDKTFYAESEWHLALVYVATGETVKAKYLLEKIVSKKGFYAKSAEKELAILTN